MLERNELELRSISIPFFANTRLVVRNYSQNTVKNKLLIISALTLISSIMLSFNIFKSNPDEDFWKWFAKNEKFIYENVENKDIQEKLFDNISSRLHKIDENLVFS